MEACARQAEYWHACDDRLHDAWPQDALTLAPRDPWTRSGGVERWGRETVTCANSWHANGHAIALELACQPP